MKSLSPAVFSPRVYVYSNNDTLSKVKAEQVEESLGNKNVKFRAIPRSREVGQSYVTSVFTTLYSFLSSFVIVAQERPDVVSCCGPFKYKCEDKDKMSIQFTHGICACRLYAPDLEFAFLLCTLR